MTDTELLRTLLGERLEIVRYISGLHARQLQNRQIFSGCELELMACERDLPRAGDAAAMAHRLDQARAQRDALQARLADDDSELTEWERRLDALDRQISGS